MDFALTDNQRAVVDGVGQALTQFDDDYWLACDRDAAFPRDFVQAMADGGWLGITMPEELGGSALGVTEAALMMREVAKAGGMTAASAIHINMFGPHAIVVHGTPDQKSRWLAPLIRGEETCCFGVTEPDAGLDTSRITTRAQATGGGFLVTGKKSGHRPRSTQIAFFCWHGPQPGKRWLAQPMG